MKEVWKKRNFFVVVILYVMVLLGITGSVFGGESRQASQTLQGDKEGDPYQELPKRVALTFDDGPHPDYTGKLLDGLKERKVRATFFVMGKQAEEYPELVKRMAQEGHLIGNHTYSHLQLKKSNREEFKEELKKTSKIVQEITGEELQYVRPPYGAWDKSFETELNMFPILWDIDPLDWCKSDASCIAQNVISKIGKDNIILMHDQYDSSIEAALLIVDELTRQGYEFVTVDELLEE